MNLPTDDAGGPREARLSVAGAAAADLRAAFAGRTVLVTGHTGFKGSWLSLWLRELGAEVTGYALDPPTEPSLFVDADVDAAVTSVIGDVRDLDHLCATVDAHRPSVVLHLAAQPLVRAAYDEPVATFDTNVVGTANVLEAIRRVGGVDAVVSVTTDKCYDNREWVWGYREDDRLGGHDPYSASKACAELVTSAYRSSFGLDVVASARAGNVIGGGDWATDRLVPDIVRAFGRGDEVVIRNPAAIRPWQHVLEPLAGYLQLAAALCASGSEVAEAWNFGPADADARPVSAIVESLADAWGAGAAWRTDDGDHPHEATYLKLDHSKATARLGWTPRLGLDEALAWTVEVYRSCLDGGDVRGGVIDQIHRYEQRLGGGA